MITITGYEKRESEKGKFFLLQLQGDVEINFSKKTGLPYATMKKCTIPSTLNETACRSLIGKEMAGSISKVKGDPYEYTIAETGEIVTIDYKYIYQPEESNHMEEAVFGEQELI